MTLVGSTDSRTTLVEVTLSIDLLRFAGRLGQQLFDNFVLNALFQSSNLAYRTMSRYGQTLTASLFGSRSSLYVLVCHCCTWVTAH